MPPILTSSARVTISPATAPQSRFDPFTTACLSGADDSGPDLDRIVGRVYASI
jgi:hypothetical protein